MDLDIGDVAIKAVASESAKRLYSQIIKLIPKASAPTNKSIERSLSTHLRYVADWANQYSFLGLSTPKKSNSATIPLRLTNIPRRYKGQLSNDAPETSEDSFLTDRKPLVLLGDPGAGKTTTLKRICLHLLQDSVAENEIEFQVPLLAVLRDLGKFESLIPYLGGVLNVPVDSVDQQDSNKIPLKIYEFDAAEKISEMLDTLNAVLIVDGLDELSPAQRPVIERELRLIATYCQSAKVIVSCRSGDYNRSIDGYSIFEILPLSRDEIVSISRCWMSDVSDFIEHLDSKPYKDIVDRPLLLSFLIFLFIAEKQLPLRPSLIYRKVVYRLLKDWDDERGISRVSAYSNFDVDAKIDFLSEFSYLLTYKLKSRGFLEEQALHILDDIGHNYEIPKKQLKEVLKEIETHTGIIVAAGFSRFEFAHLSVQEYLCANFISRSPIPQLLKAYLAEYPAPVAVACALSSQPDLFLSQMIRRHLLDKFRNPDDFFHSIEAGEQPLLDLFGHDTSNTLLSFLSRLELEQPAFRGSAEFGETLLLIYAFYYRRYNVNIDNAINGLVMPDSGRQGLHSFFGTTRWQAYAVTDDTAAIFIDSIFIDLYEEIAGPWPKDNPKAEILPIAMMPQSILRFLNIPISGVDVRRPVERIKRNISATQLCEIEFSGHLRKTPNAPCEICGNKIDSISARERRARFRNPKGQKALL